MIVTIIDPGFRNNQKYFINQPKKRRPQPAPKAITSINLAVDQDPMDASRKSVREARQGNVGMWLVTSAKHSWSSQH